MQYALVNNIKLEAVKGLNGICPGCLKEVISKCGKIKLHHWAHKNCKDCDTWWEPETEWHRNWKNKFPVEYREVVFNDPLNNEIHRADIHTCSGVTIEFQNSFISPEELRSREAFYNKLIWVVNGLKFKGGFEFLRNLPDPNDPLLEDYEFAELVYFNKREVINAAKDDLIRVYGANDTALKDIVLTNIYWAFNWRNPHKVWFDSQTYVFLDFGHEFLYWLKKRVQVRGPFWYVQVIKKAEFISKYSK